MVDRLKPERGSGFPTSGHWILLSPLDQSTPRVGEPVPRRNQPRNQPNSPPRSSGTSSLASNHVRHRPHLQARRAHRAQGLGTRPARIDREPRPRPARLGNAPSIDRSLDWIDAPKPPARRVRRVSRGGREKRGDRPRLLDRTFNIVAVGRGGPHGTVRAPERPPSARARRFFIRTSAEHAGRRTI